MSTKNLNIRVTEKEWEVLKEFCKKSGRTKTDVLREFIRLLKPDQES